MAASSSSSAFSSINRKVLLRHTSAILGAYGTNPKRKKRLKRHGKYDKRDHDDDNDRSYGQKKSRRYDKRYDQGDGYDYHRPHDRTHSNYGQGEHHDASDCLDDDKDDGCARLGGVCTTLADCDSQGGQRSYAVGLLDGATSVADIDYDAITCSADLPVCCVPRGTCPPYSFYCQANPYQIHETSWIPSCLQGEHQCFFWWFGAKDYLNDTTPSDRSNFGEGYTIEGDTIVVLDSALHNLIDTEAKLEVLGDGFSGWVEGPVWVKEEETLIFSDLYGNRIMKWTADQVFFATRQHVFFSKFPRFAE